MKKTKEQRMREAARNWYSDPSYSMNNIYGADDEKFFLGDEDDEREDEVDWGEYENPTISPALLRERQAPHLEFDGQNLRWIEDGQEKYSWPAMSGAEGYQSPDYQGLKNNGPLPEGEWNLYQSNLQHFDDSSYFDRALGKFGRGKWGNGTPSWGNHRVWIHPGLNTDTLGRDGLAIHGGDSFGSNGCIDLEHGIDDFNDKYSDYGRNMKLKVKYNKNSW